MARLLQFKGHSIQQNLACAIISDFWQKWKGSAVQGFTSTTAVQGFKPFYLVCGLSVFKTHYETTLDILLNAFWFIYTEFKECYTV